MTSRPFDPEFLDAIEGTVIRWEGRVWRQVFDGSDVFRENTRGGRWNPPGVAALYCSLSAEGAAREIDHLISLQPVPIRKRRITWEIGVRLDRVADLRDPGALAAFDVDIAAVTGPEWAAPQRTGSAAAWLHCGGLLVPSARHTFGQSCDLREQPGSRRSRRAGGKRVVPPVAPTPRLGWARRPQ